MKAGDVAPLRAEFSAFPVQSGEQEDETEEETARNAGLGVHRAKR